MIKFDVFNRFSGAVQFTAEIDCTDDAPRSIKLGLAAKWAILTGADLTAANLHGARLTGADLYGADLTAANLHGAILTGADLYGANLADANLHGARLADANLHGANLYGVILYGVILYGANLTGANLTGANLTGAILYGAILTDAILTDAILTGANLTDADLTGVVINGRKIAYAATIGRPNGWRALTYVTVDGEQRVQVGCQDKTIAEGRAYWAGKDNRREIMAALDYAEALGRIRGWGVAHIAAEQLP